MVIKLAYRIRKGEFGQTHISAQMNLFPLSTLYRDFQEIKVRPINKLNKTKLTKTFHFNKFVKLMNKLTKTFPLSKVY